MIGELIFLVLVFFIIPVTNLVLCILGIIKLLNLF